MVSLDFQRTETWRDTLQIPKYVYFPKRNARVELNWIYYAQAPFCLKATTSKVESLVHQLTDPYAIEKLAEKDPTGKQ